MAQLKKDTMKWGRQIIYPQSTCSPLTMFYPYSFLFILLIRFFVCHFLFFPLSVLSRLSHNKQTKKSTQKEQPIPYTNSSSLDNFSTLSTMSAKRSQAQSIGSPTSSTGNGEGNSNGSDQHLDKKFKQVHGDGDGDDDDDDDDDEDAPKSGKRAGRRKIKIEYIEDKSRRHITFSKRKSGIMKKVICMRKQGYIPCVLTVFRRISSTYNITDT